MMAAPSGIYLRIVIAGLTGALLCACGDPAQGPEEALRSWVSQGQQFAAAKDRRALVDMISPTYTDARGNSRDDIENMFRFYFLRQQSVALITRIEELRVYDDSAAELVLAVGMAGTSEGTFGFSADAYRFEMEFERDDDEWLLTSARWGEFGGDLH
jgi:hypothetical protein